MLRFFSNIFKSSNINLKFKALKKEIAFCKYAVKRTFSMPLSFLGKLMVFKIIACFSIFNKLFTIDFKIRLDSVIKQVNAPQGLYI